VEAASRASIIAEGILSGSVPLELSVIWGLVSAGGEQMPATVATYVFFCCWLFGVIDAWRLGGRLGGRLGVQARPNLPPSSSRASGQ
jgi:hypothetical protein